MKDCEKCDIENCGVLNRSECPINRLWRKARELEGDIEKVTALQEVEKILKGGEVCEN